jgi:hypothetical protein
MKASFFFLSFLIFCNITFGQNSPSDFLNDKCSYETDGTGKSMGLKIKLVHPCSWTQANGDRPHVVQKFSYSFGDGSSLNQSLTISKMPATPSKKEIAELFTQEGLKEMVKELGTFVSARKVKIDGMDCGEVTVKVKRESPAVTIYMYFIQYYLIYKDKMINVSFAAGGKTETEAKNLYTKYKLLLQTLATNTVLISKWE